MNMFIRWLVTSFIRPFLCSFIHQPIHSFIYALAISLIYLFISFFIHSFIHCLFQGFVICSSEQRYLYPLRMHLYLYLPCIVSGLRDLHFGAEISASVQLPEEEPHEEGDGVLQLMPVCKVLLRAPQLHRHPRHEHPRESSRVILIHHLLFSNLYDS